MRWRLDRGPAFGFRRLEKALPALRDDPRVTLPQCAAGKKDGEPTLHLTRDDQNSSLLPPTASGFSYAGPSGTLMSPTSGRVRQADAVFVRADGG